MIKNGNEYTEVVIDWDDCICCVVSVPNFVKSEQMKELIEILKKKPQSICIRDYISINWVKKSEILLAKETIPLKDTIFHGVTGELKHIVPGLWTKEQIENTKKLLKRLYMKTGIISDKWLKHLTPVGNCPTEKVDLVGYEEACMSISPEEWEKMEENRKELLKQLDMKTGEWKPC